MRYLHGAKICTLHVCYLSTDIGLYCETRHSVPFLTSRTVEAETEKALFQKIEKFRYPVSFIFLEAPTTNVLLKN